MPHINKVRLVNVNFNDAKGMYDDFIMDLNGKSTTYDLMNTGGKSLLLLMMLQTVLPNTYLKKEKPLKNIFVGGNPKRTSHCLIEWILDEGYQYKYMLTGFCARKKLDQGFDEVQGEDKLEIDYYNYCYFYNEPNRYDIKYIPLVTKENGEKEYMSYDKLRQLISNMKKDDLPVQIFDSKKEYLKNIEYYGLISAEWKLISEINVSENYIEKYFKENKTSRKLIEIFLIKIIDNVNHDEEENQLADTLIELKDNLMEFRKKSDNKLEYVQTGEMFNELKEKNQLLIDEFFRAEKINKKAYEAFAYNTDKKENLKNKIQNEENQIEDLKKENFILEKLNKKLEIDKLYFEKNNIENEIEKINTESDKLKVKFNAELRKLKLSKAQNEYVDYFENKEKAEQIKIQMDNLSLGENDLKEKYEKYGYSYKIRLEKQIEQIIKKYEEQRKFKIEKEEAKKIAKKLENDAREILSKFQSKIEILEEKIKDIQDNIYTITQYLTDNGQMEILLNLQAGINTEKEKLEQLKNDIEENNKKAKELEKEQINSEINLEKLNLNLNMSKEKLNDSLKEIEQYEKRKNSLEKLAITFRVGEKENFEILSQKLEDELQAEEQARIVAQMEKGLKTKKLDLIQKYNMVVPNEDIFYLKEKLQNKCNYITTGIEKLMEIDEKEKQEFLLKNPLFVYSVFIDDESFRKLQSKNLDIEFENLVPIASVEVLRGKKELEEKDFIFPVQKSIYQNLSNQELENYIENLRKNITSLEEKISLYNHKEEKIRNYLTEINQLQKDYPNEKVIQIYQNKEEKEKKIEKIESEIKETCRIRENQKEEFENTKKTLEEEEEKLEYLKKEIDELEELEKLQNNDKEIRNQKEQVKKDYEVQKELLQEKEEIYTKIEQDLETIKNEMLETEKLNEKLQFDYDKLPDFKFTTEVDESFENLKNHFEALDDKMRTSNKQFGDLQNLYKMHTNMMEKCKQNIEENECELTYFYERGQVQKVPNTVLEELANQVKGLEAEVLDLKKSLDESGNQKISIEGKIELLVEQLLKEKEEEYLEENRIKEIDVIEKNIKDNTSKIKINRKQIIELGSKIKNVESEFKNLDRECELLKNFIAEKEVEKFEVNTTVLLESEIYTFNTISEERKKLDKSLQKLQNKFSEYIDYMKNKVENYFIKQDVLDAISEVKIPTKLSEAQIIKNGFDEIISLLDEKIRHIDEALKELEGYQQNFITKCFEKAETIVRDLNKLPGLSRIKIGGKDINIIKLDLFEYEKEEKQNKMKEYIYSLVKEMEKDPEKMNKEYLNECLSSKALVSQIVNMDKACVKLYKIEDIQENSTYKKWEDDLGSDGQVNAIYFMFAVCIISYISMLTRKESSGKLKKVIIADNPFGATSAVFLWDVMFSILKENNVQLIAPGHNINKEIVSMFEVNYILKHEYYNSNKKSVVVDKEIRTEEDLDEMNFDIIDGDQQSMFF